MPAKRKASYAASHVLYTRINGEIHSKVAEMAAAAGLSTAKMVEIILGEAVGVQTPYTRATEQIRASIKAARS